MDNACFPQVFPLASWIHFYGFTAWVLLGKDPGDALRMAVDCVEEPREGEAEDGPQEKHPNHHLLLDRSHERHVGPEHVHQTQTEEKQAACKENEGQSEISIRIKCCRNRN